MEIYRNFSLLGEFFSSARIDERKETSREKSEREKWRKWKISAFNRVTKVNIIRLSLWIEREREIQFLASAENRRQGEERSMFVVASATLGGWNCQVRQIFAIRANGRAELQFVTWRRKSAIIRKPSGCNGRATNRETHNQSLPFEPKSHEMSHVSGRIQAFESFFRRTRVCFALGGYACILRNFQLEYTGCFLISAINFRWFFVEN